MGLRREVPGPGRESASGARGSRGITALKERRSTTLMWNPRVLPCVSTLLHRSIVIRGEITSPVIAALQRWR